jgi:hypothetical protein
MFESCLARQFGTKLGMPKPTAFALGAATSARRSALFDPMMRASFASHLEALGQRARVVPAVAARLGSHPPADLAGEGIRRLGLLRRYPARVE